MQVRDATPSDLPRIRELFAAQEKSATWTFTDAMLNTVDTTLVAEDGDRVAGMLWAGLMANATFAYIGTFAIHPDYRKLGVGAQLAKAMSDRFQARGVQDVFALVKRDEYHTAVLKNASRLAQFKMDVPPYTYIYGVPNG